MRRGIIQLESFKLGICSRTSDQRESGLVAD
jgi:hypothetical protein